MKKLDNFSNCLAILATADFKLAETNDIYRTGIIGQFNLTFELASTGFRIFAINFLFSGINIVSSGIFTALSNGKISAILSFLRTLFFLVICLVTFPYFLGITGVWLAVPAAEFLTLILSARMNWHYFIRKTTQKYF